MIRFDSHYQPAVWGGRQLGELFGRALPEGPVGEAWELVELPERESTAISGRFRGQKLGALWRQGVLGGSGKGPFPFLLKWLDARDKLSVQVHPDEEACARMGRGRPKTEAWYVVQGGDESSLLIGHHAGLDGPTLRQAAQNGTMAKWLYDIRPNPGDMYLLRAGTVHAIGGGLMLLEVQQPSDTTYRIYDWDRLGVDGKMRTLHIDDSIACIDFAKHGPPQVQRGLVTGPCFAMQTLQKGAVVEGDGLRVLVADHGPALLTSARTTTSLLRGDVIVAEPEDGLITIAEGSVAYLTEP